VGIADRHRRLITVTVVIAWIVEGTWPACVDAARAHAPGDADIALLHVTASEVSGVARGAYAGLLGRARPGRDPGTRLEHLATASAGQLLADAAGRLGRPCTRIQRTGRIEREVVAAAEGADLLILATIPPPPHPPHQRHPGNQPLPSRCKITRTGIRTPSRRRAQCSAKVLSSL
jgi:hypothetical protein